MKKLNRLLLINWLNYSFELLNFGKITFLTGKNASGKSTIIDAMQLVMLGDTAGNFFNKAANEKSGRTLQSYLYGYLPSYSDQLYKPLRTDAFTSYVVMEFYDETRREYFSAGFVADCPKESKSSFSYRYFIIRDSIPADHFITDDGFPKRISELRNFFENKYGRGKTSVWEIFNTNREYREASLFAFGNLKDQYRKILRKAVSFSPITNITNFINEYICTEQNEIDISTMQQNIRNYTSLEEIAHVTERKISDLETVREQYKRFSDAKKNQRLYNYFLARVQLESCKEKLALATDELNAKLASLKEAGASISKLDEEIAKTEAHMESLKEKKYSSGLEAKKRELEKEISDLAEKLSSASKCEKDIKIYLENLSAKYKDAIGRLRDKSGVDLVPGEAIIMAIGEVDRDRIMRLDYPALSKAVTEASKWFTAHYNEEARVISELGERIEILKKEISNLEKGIKPYPEATVSFKKRLEAVFDREILFLSDALEIRDPVYQSTLEALLGERRFFLLLEEDERAEASKLLEEEFVHSGVGFITPSKEIEAGSDLLASFFTSENKAAEAYISALSALLKAENLTAEGILTLQAERSALREETSLFIGKRAIKAMLEKKQAELDALLREKDEKDALAVCYRRGTYCPPFEAYRAENYAEGAKKIMEIPELETAKKEKEKELYSPDLLALEELDEEIAQDEKKKKEIEIERGNLLRETGEYEADIKRLKAETIPSSVTAIANLENSIKDDFPEDAIGAMEEEFVKSYRVSKAKENIVEQYNSQCKRFKTVAEGAKSDLMALRQNYNGAYHAGLDITRDDNDEYEAEYVTLSQSKLPEYLEKIKEAKDSAYRQFKNDFLNKMSDNIKSTEIRIKDFNKVLSKYHFGDDGYEFSVQSAKGYEQYYRMFTSEELTAGTDSLFSQFFLERYQKELDELFEILLPSSKEENTAEKEKTIQKYIDYKTYLSFDLIVKNASGRQNLSETIIVKSGGEVQIPFYISVLASFAQICRIDDEKYNNTVRLVIFDEAFSKMDGERIRECLRLLKDFDLQVVFSAPPEKTMDIASFADLIIVAYREGRSSYARSFSAGELKNAK